MKTLYLTRGQNILIDQENNSCNRLRSSRLGVDYLYVAKEPMHVVYGYGEGSKELDVEEGDIIITFYTDSKHHVIAVKNQEWLENILEYEKEEQEEKERWAASKAADSQNKKNNYEKE